MVNSKKTPDGDDDKQLENINEKIIELRDKIEELSNKLNLLHEKSRMLDRRYVKLSDINIKKFAIFSANILKLINQQKILTTKMRYYSAVTTAWIGVLVIIFHFLSKYILSLL